MAERMQVDNQVAYITRAGQELGAEEPCPTTPLGFAELLKNHRVRVVYSSDYPPGQVALYHGLDEHVIGKSSEGHHVIVVGKRKSYEPLSHKEKIDILCRLGQIKLFEKYGSYLTQCESEHNPEDDRPLMHPCFVTFAHGVMGLVE